MTVLRGRSTLKPPEPPEEEQVLRGRATVTPPGATPPTIPAPTGIPTVPGAAAMLDPADPRMPRLPSIDQIEMAKLTGQLQGPGWDIEELKSTGGITPKQYAEVQEIATGRPSPPPTREREPFRWWFQSEAVGAQGIDVDIGLTAEEKKKVADALATNTCPGEIQTYYTPKLWEVKISGQDNIFVEALTKKDAQAKAEAAGHEGIYAVSRVFDWDPRFTADAPATAKTGTIVKVKDGKTGETLEFPKDAWDAWPEKYQVLVTSKGYDAAMDAFRADHAVCSITGLALPRDVWNAIQESDKATGTNFRQIGLAYGFDRMLSEMEDHRQEWLTELKTQDPELYQLYEQGKHDQFGTLLNQRIAAHERVIEPLEKNYKSEDGYDVLGALLDGKVSYDDAMMVFREADLADARHLLDVKAKWDTDPTDAQRRLATVEAADRYRPFGQLDTAEKVAVLEHYAFKRGMTSDEMFKHYMAKEWQATKNFAIAITPVVGTAHYWKGMSTPMKVLSIVGDVLCVAAVVHAASA